MTREFVVVGAVEHVVEHGEGLMAHLERRGGSDQPVETAGGVSASRAARIVNSKGLI